MLFELKAFEVGRYQVPKAIERVTNIAYVVLVTL